MGDVIFSFLVLLIGLPVFVVIALLVKLSSPGPVFYIQERIGRYNTRFGCIMFRTMRVNADSILSNLLANSPSLRVSWHILQIKEVFLLSL